MNRSTRWQHRIPAPDNIRQALDGIDTITTQYNKGKPCMDNFPNRRLISDHTDEHITCRTMPNKYGLALPMECKALHCQQANMLSGYQKQHVTSPILESN
jgi:hypothetical protein